MRRLALLGAAAVAAAALSSGGVQARPSVAAARPTSVLAMVVGRGNTTLLRARQTSIAAVRVGVPGAGSCGFAGGTPLAVLDSARRSRLLRYHLRRQRTCTPSQVFVDSVDGQGNGGFAGWVYKVNGRVGSTSAADPSGPFGDGRRLRSGDRVLWFYCVNALRCQRTLVVRPASASAIAGARLGVSVMAVDDHGRQSPAAGAAVTLANGLTITDRGGRAVITVPTQPGSYPLAATSPGLVPSFPETVAVR